MSLTEKDISEFKKLYKDHYGEEINDFVAYEAANHLVNMIRAVYKPIPKSQEEQYDKIKEKHESVPEEKKFDFVKHLVADAKVTELKTQIGEKKFWELVIKSRNMEKNIPQIIKEVGFDFSWEEEKVWKLDVPIEEMDISELTWHFDIPFLWENGGVYNLMPRDVIKNSEAHKEEYDRTMKADIKYPIDIMENKGRWLILDGLHRLMKASILGQNKVQVRKVSRDKIPEILKG